MKARIIVVEGGKPGVVFPLPEPGTTIGRGDENHIRLRDPDVSRRHAAIHAKDNMWVIKDQGSTNGLFVNGARVAHAVLKNRDKIGIGPFELVFEAVADDAPWDGAAGPPAAPEARMPTVERRLAPDAPKTVPHRLD